MNNSVLDKADLPIKLFYRGKVRDTYDLGHQLLIIATDRISAFDSVLPTNIPDKGIVLNQLSSFWFKQTKQLVPNHLIETIEDLHRLDEYLDKEDQFDYPTYLLRRSMIVRKAERLPIECVVRGYLAGSAWAEYRQYGTVFGTKLPKGLKESQELPQPLFTPTTKAESGHDEPISIEEMKELIGDMTEEIKVKSLAVYDFARSYAQTKGIIIADTKMEFGLFGEKLILIDELLTPDSSRFWDVEHYQVGKSQDSYDKQPVRDWLVQSGWNKEPPAPELPADITQVTAARYRTAYERLTGMKLTA